VTGLGSNIIANISLSELVNSLGLSILYAVLLSFVVRKYSNIIGNRFQYFIIFPILIPTMVLIISIIKSSLALSLGLVGALSIVRFRTPIKEPEELIYLFFAIAIGLGLGAGQLLPTSVCFIVIMLLIVILGSYKRATSAQGIFLDIDGTLDPSSNPDGMFCSDILKEYKVSFDLRRYEVNQNQFSATFYLEAKDIDTVHEIIGALRKRNQNLNINLINKTRDLH
jgi:hypothetical protein